MVNKALRMKFVLLFSVVALLGGSVPVFAQQGAEQQAIPDGVQVQFNSSFVGVPVVETFLMSDTPQELTREQKALMEKGLNRSNLTGPRLPKMDAGAAADAPLLGTESNMGSRASTPGSALLFRYSNMGAIPPAGFASEIMETSHGQGGKNIFYTGNWFAARSINGGATWGYLNPFSDYPKFCCDQVALYDPARNMMIWYRQEIASATGENTLRVSVSNDGGATWASYTIGPKNVNSAWTGQWFDYPHLQIAGDYLYIATNVFNASNSWTRTVMLRWPLDALKARTGFGYNYFETSSWFTFVPVAGADHVMYFASNWPNVEPFNRIAIWKWAENSTSITQVVKSVAAWSTTSRGQVICGANDSGNWLARTDQRLLSGAVYRYQGSNLQYFGRNVIGFWWNVKQGGNFPRPYIDGAAFFESDLTQVAGLQGRPYMYNSTDCFAYPSFAPNDRGDLGFVTNWATSGSGYKPAVIYGIADDYALTPPGFAIRGLNTSSWRPAQPRFGDYNTVRAFEPGGSVWTGSAHIIGTNALGGRLNTPLYFVFGRERDYMNWANWYLK